MYAGPVGWFGGGESEFAVGIRSALVKQVSCTIFLLRFSGNLYHSPKWFMSLIVQVVGVSVFDQVYISILLFFIK